MTRAVTAARLADVFERAPGLAERVAARLETDDVDAIVAAAREELARMSERERIAVLDAHPRIGAPPASLSARSRAEQGADSDGSASRALAELNEAYERKFGFRLVVFVGGRTRSALLPVLRERLGRSRDDELRIGVEEFLAISRDRLRRP
jgi:2-oxo-4-hydroxy-4-carboxy--5-ureidoimidazoline (OHCU) decarboxylase